MVRRLPSRRGRVTCHTTTGPLCFPGVSFTKLDEGIVLSTIWREPDHVLRVWIAMLARKDRHGEVHASIPGLAGLSLVTVEQCEDALARFRAPDKYSRTQAFDGRRIEDIPGGWFILNHEKYKPRDGLTERQEKDRERQQRHRERAKRAHLRPDLEGFSGLEAPEDGHVMSRDSHGLNQTVTKTPPDVDVDVDGGTTTSAKAGGKNWLAPVLRILKDRLPKVPYKAHAGPWAKITKQLLDDGNTMDQICDQVAKFCAETQPKFIKAALFISAFGTYTGKPAKVGKGLVESRKTLSRSLGLDN